jgi:ribosomal protein S18 acetylase RimI-like enzyme
MSVVIQEMGMRDYDEVLALWQTSKGVGLSDADSKDGIARFLARNPGFSFVAREHDLLVGAILCGHDGRRGYIHHLAVSTTHRHRGVGGALADRALSALKAAGIQKCHLFVFTDNREALAFWKAIGWTQRIELFIMSRYTEDAASPSFGDHSRL